jgi:hypothetical protein
MATDEIENKSLPVEFQQAFYTRIQYLHVSSRVSVKRLNIFPDKIIKWKPVDT